MAFPRVLKSYFSPLGIQNPGGMSGFYAKLLLLDMKHSRACTEDKNCVTAVKIKMKLQMIASVFKRNEICFCNIAEG